MFFSKQDSETSLKIDEGSNNERKWLKESLQNKGKSADLLPLVNRLLVNEQRSLRSNEHVGALAEFRRGGLKYN